MLKTCSSPSGRRPSAVSALSTAYTVKSLPGAMLYIPVKVFCHWIFVTEISTKFVILSLSLRWRMTTTLRCRSNDHFLTLKSISPLL